MTHYLLSVHSVTTDPLPGAHPDQVEGEVRVPMTEEQLRQMHQRLGAVEEDLKSTGAWVFSGRLHEPDTATVVRESGGEVLTTDGPFAESKEYLGGFYIIEAKDLDDALAWAGRVTAAIKVPIEVWPFADARGA